jgi:hypothetical protein
VLGRDPSGVATALSRTGTAGLAALAVLDLARVLDLAGPWLVAAAACLVLWVAPPLVVAAQARHRRRRSTVAAWRSLQERIGAERDGPGRR